MSNKHPLEQAVLDDYMNIYALSVKIGALVDMSPQKERFKDVFDLCMKKGAAAKMMIDYLNKTGILPEKN